MGADSEKGGSIHALDRATGRQRWTLPAGRGVTTSISGGDSKAYAITMQGELLSLEVATGDRRWGFPVKVMGWQGVSVSSEFVFVGAADGSLYVLNPLTGSLEWKTNLGDPITTAVTIVGTDLYAGTADGSLHRIDIRKGILRGSLKIDARLMPTDLPLVTGNGILVLLADDSADNRALVSVDLNLESIRWRQAAEKRWSTTRLFLLHDSVFLGSPDGRVMGYCVRDGNRIWIHEIGGTIRAIGGAGDSLYIGTTEGNLTALRPAFSCR